MSATTPNVGVRVFSDLRQTLASIDARVTRIAMVLPTPNADNSIEMHKPISISTDDTETIALLGAGEAKNTLDQIASEGIITDVLFVRAVALASSFWWFGWGLAFALGVAGIGYLNFVFLGSSTAAIHEIIWLVVHGKPVEDYGNEGDGVWITATLVGGIAAAVGSLALFIGGVLATLETIAGNSL